MEGRKKAFSAALMLVITININAIEFLRVLLRNAGNLSSNQFIALFLKAQPVRCTFPESPTSSLHFSWKPYQFITLFLKAQPVNYTLPER